MDKRNWGRGSGVD